MKKIVPILGLSVLLAGCGSTTTMDSSITDGKNVVIEGSEISLTKDDLYHALLENYGSAQIIDIALNFIADKEITDEAAVEAKLTETLDSYASSMPDGIDVYAQDLGFKDGNDYIDTAIRPGIKQDLLREKYVDENYDTLVKDYHVRYLKTIAVDTESVAMDIIDKSTSLEVFNTYLTQYSGQDVGMVTKESTSVDANVIDNLDAFTKNGIYSKAIETTDGKFVVVYVYNTDKKDLKEEIRTQLLSSSGVATDYEIHYLTKYKFDVYENKIKEDIEEINEDYLG
jgi:hypothetical protein